MKLTAIHSIQTTDKDGNRVDVAPGKQFDTDSKQGAELVLAGAAKEYQKSDKTEDSPSTADGLPAAPAGYAPGTPTQNDVNGDPNTGDAAADAAVLDGGSAAPPSTTDTATKTAGTASTSGGRASTSASK